MFASRLAEHCDIFSPRPVLDGVVDKKVSVSGLFRGGPSRIAVLTFSTAYCHLLFNRFALGIRSVPADAIGKC
jgi:hypothetical protein